MRFESMEELMEFYYGPSQLIRKGDKAITTADAAIFNTIFGKKVWSQLNLEANAFAMIPKEPWNQSGWRVLKTAAASFPSGGVAEGGILPETIEPNFQELEDSPKTVIHGFKVSEIAEFLSSVDDAIDIIPELRREMGEEHARAINAMLLDDVDDLAGDNIESLDRVVSSLTDEIINAGAGDADIYGIDRSNAANSWADAYVNASGTAGSPSNRDLTLTLIDDVYQGVWNNGGRPKVIMTGVDTLMRWQQLLEAERRFMETARVVPTFGGVRGVAPGVEAGFMVATYLGLPIIVSQDMPSDTISHIHFYDTDYLRLRVSKPTVYFESARNQGFVYMNYLGMEGYYETTGELICTRFNAQGKLVNLQ